MSDGDPTLSMRLRPGTGGAIECVAGITWPNGHYSEWSESAAPDEVTQQVGFELADLLRAGVVTPVGDDQTAPTWSRVGPGLAGEVGAGWSFDPKERGSLAWNGNKPATADFRATTYDALAMQKFMRAVMRGDVKVGKSAHMDRLRATNAAIQADQRLAALEWSRASKANRDNIRDKWGPPGGLEKFLKDAGAAVVDVAKVALPIASVFVPALLPAAAALIAATKIAAQAKAVVKTVTSVAAKAKTVRTVATALANPVTQKALARVGVTPAQSERASNLLQGVHNAATALAYNNRGDIAKANAFALAAAKNAAAAKAPAAAVQAAGKKLLYLALAPGDA